MWLFLVNKYLKGLAEKLLEGYYTTISELNWVKQKLGWYFIDPKTMIRNVIYSWRTYQQKIFIYSLYVVDWLKPSYLS